MKNLRNKIEAVSLLLCACFVMMAAELSAVSIPHSAKIDIDSLGNKVAVWELADSGITTIQAAYCLSDGSEWSASHQLSPTTINSTNFNSKGPKLAINSNGQAVVVWLSTIPNSSINGLYAATISLQASATWTTATAVSNLSESVQKPLEDENYSIKLQESGKAVALWQTVESNIETSTSTVSEGSNIWSAPILVTGAA